MMSTESVSGRSRCFLVLVVLVWLCSAARQSQSCAIVYSRLGDSGTRDSATCGQDRTQPCRTIGQAISNAAASPDTCTAVQLLSSRYDDEIVCENLTSVSDVLIDGSEAGTIQLRNTNCSDVMGSGFSSWIMLWNVSDVTLQHLNISLVNITCDGAIVMQWSYNITIQHSAFGFPRINTSSILSMGSKALRIWACEFYGAQIPDPYRDFFELPQYRIAAILFKRSCQFDCSEMSPRLRPCCLIPQGSRLNSPSSSLGYDIWLEGCSFHDLGIGQEYRLYSSSRRFEDAVSLHIDSNAVRSLTAIVENCTFTNLTSPYDTVLKLFAGGSSSDVQLTIRDSTFRYGYAFTGGSLFVRADTTTKNLTLRVSNCNFYNNTAVVSGGAIALSFAVDRFTSFTDGTRSLLAIIEGCHFGYNQAGGLSTNAAGGAISASSTDFFASVVGFVQNLPTLRVSNSSFLANSAPFAAGVFVTGFELDVADSLFMLQQGDSAITVSSSWAKLGSNVTFLNNSSPRHGGAISLVQYSILSILSNGSTYFFGNSAGYSGGALFADMSSSTNDIADTIQYQTNVGLTKPCFLQSSPGVQYSFNSSHSKAATVVFRDNRSPVGSAVFANSYTACLNEQSPLLTDLNRTVADVGQSTGAQVTSGAVWINFKSAGCDCYKPNPVNVSNFWLYHRVCNRETIFADAWNNSLFLNTDYSRKLDLYTTFTYEYLKSTVDVSGYGVLSSRQTFSVPWAISNYQWQYPRNFGESNEYASRRLGPRALASTYISSLVLYPAPGELFPLEIDLADVFFNLAYSLVWVQIESGDALLIYTGYVYAYGEPILFVPSSPAIIGIAGRPGAEGTLVLGTNGQLASSNLQLRIAFRLRPCHIGFSETPFMQNTTQAIHEFVTKSLRTPVTQDVNSPSNQLVCQCPSRQGVAGVLDCVNGTAIRMDWQYWAGPDHGEEALNVVPPLSYLSNITAHEAQLRTQKFLTSVCYGGFCTDHGQTPWNVRQDQACISSRDGVICGSCVDGYAIGLSWLPICVKCTASGEFIGRLFFFLIFLYAGVDLFIFSYFETGRSAVFDSWVNFEQFCLFMTRREITFFTLTSYGPLICVSGNDTILQMTGALYMVSAAFVIWLVVVFQLSRIVAVRRFILNYSLVTGMWAALTFSYAYLLLPSFNLLACRYFDDRWVMFYDASISCFGSAHWPWGLLALFALLGIVIPIPIVLIVKRSSPRVKPLVDVYLSYVKDDRHWYIAFTMFRRIVHCMVSVYVIDTTPRQLALAFLMQIWLFLHFIIQPYRRKIDNMWEALFLGFASFYAILNILPIGARPVLEKLLWATYVIPVSASFLCGFYNQRRKLLILVECFLTLLLFPLLFIHARAKGKPFQRLNLLKRDAGDGSSEPLIIQSTEKMVERAKTVYHLRDDLLVDVFDEPDASVST